MWIFEWGGCFHNITKVKLVLPQRLHSPANNSTRVPHTSVLAACHMQTCVLRFIPGLAFEFVSAPVATCMKWWTEPLYCHSCVSLKAGTTGHKMPSRAYSYFRAEPCNGFPAVSFRFADDVVSVQRELLPLQRCPPPPPPRLSRLPCGRYVWPNPAIVSIARRMNFFSIKQVNS